MVKYSFIDIIRNALSLIYTKCFFPKARLIRWPLYRSGAMFKYGKGLTLGRGCRIDVGDDGNALVIGENARIGDYVHINAEKQITIGNNVLMASHVFITDASHGVYTGICQSKPDSNPSQRELMLKSVKIGNNVWIGEHVVILQGTEIGDGCIIGANSVVPGISIPSNTIVGGVPAHIIKLYNNTSNSWDRYSS